jgi:hypothetical protein
VGATRIPQALHASGRTDARRGSPAFAEDDARRVFQRGTLREAEHAMLAGVVGAAPGDADEAAQRRTIDDRAAALRPHRVAGTVDQGNAARAWAKAPAGARPMPEAAPVTSATLPRKSWVMVASPPQSGS